jgi:hypothetical protein
VGFGASAMFNLQSARPSISKGFFNVTVIRRLHCSNAEDNFERAHQIAAENGGDERWKYIDKIMVEK